MATEALRPHDCLLRSSDPRPCHLRARLPRRPVDDRKRRKGSITSVSGESAAGKVTGGGGGMEPATAGREWLRPRQEAVRMQIRLNPSANNTRGADEYAGTAFSMSPSPRKLPLPSLSWRKEEGAALATKDLRRLLRLE